MNRCCVFSSTFSIQKFSGIKDVVWIKRTLERPMQLARNIARCLWPPAFFCQANSVFAGNDSAPCKDLRQEFIESDLNFLANGGVTIVAIGHDVDVNIAITGMTETRDRKTGLLRKRFGKLDQIDKSTPRNNNIFVQFR